MGRGSARGQFCHHLLMFWKSCSFITKHSNHHDFWRQVDLISGFHFSSQTVWIISCLGNSFKDDFSSYRENCKFLVFRNKQTWIRLDCQEFIKDGDKTSFLDVWAGAGERERWVGWGGAAISLLPRSRTNFWTFQDGVEGEPPTAFSLLDWLFLFVWTLSAAQSVLCKTTNDSLGDGSAGLNLWLWTLLRLFLVCLEQQHEAFTEWSF